MARVLCNDYYDYSGSQVYSNTYFQLETDLPRLGKWLVGLFCLKRFGKEMDTSPPCWILKTLKPYIHTNGNRSARWEFLTAAPIWGSLIYYYSLEIPVLLDPPNPLPSGGLINNRVYQENIMLSAVK